MIRLIATDLDGTLLSDPNTIHPDNVAALREAVEAGVHLVAASGRRSESSSLLMLDAGFQTAHIIGANGCQICDAPLAPPFCARYLPVEAAREGFAVRRAERTPHLPANLLQAPRRAGNPSPRQPFANPP